MWSRVILASILVGSLFFFRQRYKVFSFNTAHLFYFLIAVYALTVLYLSILRKSDKLLILTYLQASIDILLVTFLVYLTGGIDSGFTLLYHLAIISSSILLYRQGGYLSASLASILYGLMLDLQYYNVPGFSQSQNFTAMQVLYQVFISILSFYIMALLSGYLAERLRRTRQELREKSINFEDLRVLQDHILRSVGSGILTMDLQGNIASWNPAAESVTGYSHEEINNCWKQVFAESIKGIFGHADSMREKPFRFNGQIVKKNGEKALLGMTASLLRDEANTVRGIILVFQDITKLVEMEDQVRRQDRLASVGSLAAGIAHEIRNPLASISGSIQVLKSELELKDDNKHLMEIVVREADRLNTIISELLEYARPRNAQNEQVGLASILDDTVMLLKNSGNVSKEITYIREVDPLIVLQGDSQRLRQVFWNLLINACQAMQTGGVLTIKAVQYVHDDEDTSWCEILISDTGIGIAQGSIDRIFDPFYTTKNGGTGLGLAVAYRIIDDHQGTITVESVPGKGTTFRVRLPMNDEMAASRL